MIVLMLPRRPAVCNPRALEIVKVPVRWIHGKSVFGSPGLSYIHSILKNVSRDHKGYEKTKLESEKEDTRCRCNATYMLGCRQDEAMLGPLREEVGNSMVPTKESNSAFNGIPIVRSIVAWGYPVRSIRGASNGNRTPRGGCIT